MADPGESLAEAAGGRVGGRRRVIARPVVVPDRGNAPLDRRRFEPGRGLIGDERGDLLRMRGDGR